ncbi:MAG: MurR/RpiR family transcriptional regulator [Lachnospiraceae bacterium]|nr:MurR/RpiR family transcriptional regulator [Lachnospiraceae bacterium]
MDHTIIERISKTKLTKTEKKIADFFINNQEKIGALSALDAAKEIGVSDASIIRFARSIGYSGYADLKEHFYQSLVQNSFGTLSLSERQAQADKKYGSGNIQEQYLSIVRQNIDVLFENNRQENIDLVVDGLIAARKKYIVGMRGCRGQALQLGRSLAFLLPEVFTINDAECTSLSRMQDMDEGDAMLMFYFPRYYQIDRCYLELAKKRKAKVFLITSDVTGEPSSYADVVLMVQTTSMSFAHSTLGVQVLSEYLSLLIGRKVDSRDRLEERDDMVAYQRV